MQIWLKRAYDQPGPQDGCRVLVDRIWPRGVAKEEAVIDLWLREVAPSSELRQWFGHEKEKWEEFRLRYFAELDDRDEPVERLLELVEEGRVTLVFGAADEEHNNAVALKEYLIPRRKDKS